MFFFDLWAQHNNSSSLSKYFKYFEFGFVRFQVIHCPVSTFFSPLESLLSVAIAQQWYRIKLMLFPCFYLSFYITYGNVFLTIFIYFWANFRCGYTPIFNSFICRSLNLWMLRPCTTLCGTYACCLLTFALVMIIYFVRFVAHREV